eukprot:2515435-Pyramimonas_sp.AAC.2
MGLGEEGWRQGKDDDRGCSASTRSCVHFVDRDSPSHDRAIENELSSRALGWRPRRWARVTGRGWMEVGGHRGRTGGG